MSEHYTVGQYLLDRLKEMGIGHVFGVPGDYAFPLFAALEADPDLAWVGECNELSGAYAADGYARIHGVGAYMVTCGVGELSASCGLAGAFSEGVPIVAIVGHPPTEAPKGRQQTHHGLRNDFDGFARIAAEMTCDHAVLTTQNATAEVDRVLTACWAQKLPVYLAVPQDVGDQPADRPSTKLALSTPQGDPARLDAFLSVLLGRLQAAGRPVILADAAVGRYGLTSVVQDFAAQTGIPVATVFSGISASFDETRPEFLGTYLGVPGDQITERVAGADLLLRLGLRVGETNQGAADLTWHDDTVIDLGIDTARVADTTYSGVGLDGVMRALTAQVGELGDYDALPALAPRDSFSLDAQAAITQDRLYARLATFLREDDVFVVDQGTCNSATGVPKPAGVDTITQFSWGAIGFAPPALVGTQVAAPDRRHVMITGDGALQMTAQSIATVLRHGFAPIIFVLNNGRYVIENVVGFAEPQDNAYNHLHSWDYHRLVSVFDPTGNAVGIKVHTEGELDGALHDAAKHHDQGRCTLIEVMLSPDDVPSVLTRTFGALLGSGS
ncbi:alpha-keto acid decarboxylase family protein [Mycobacterium sp.]|uniref:alpha-keto acid decarboxylase family protein n=1 Tax=Mycobacterium sp. TaxID=1785 RepID=UPI003D0BFBEC